MRESSARSANGRRCGTAILNLIYDHQGGPRGGDKTFANGMVMGMAQRPLGDGTLGFGRCCRPTRSWARAAIRCCSPPARPPTATRLIDRQHPHDLFMELSASYSHKLSATAASFVYAGLPGEPALGPPAFMHRICGMDIPEAPITHHWLDSTHITFGVVTAGLYQSTSGRSRPRRFAAASLTSTAMTSRRRSSTASARGSRGSRPRTVDAGVMGPLIRLNSSCRMSTRTASNTWMCMPVLRLQRIAVLRRLPHGGRSFLRPLDQPEAIALFSRPDQARAGPFPYGRPDVLPPGLLHRAARAHGAGHPHRRLVAGGTQAHAGRAACPCPAPTPGAAS